MSLNSRFWSKVEKTESCWNWTAYIHKSGYGRFYLNGKIEHSHRLSYEEKYGKIPQGLQIDHLCRNRKCCNPDHLEAVTHLVNVQRGLAGKINNNQSKKTHCPQGHEYNEENTVDISGRRHCRLCRQIRARQDYQRKKLEMLQ